ncbi:MAG TPA: tRNA (guanosine(37)-N1)-methyltransferase TrmD [Verrucomicrobiae bacterium]|nr:tRNA (guanosine(37)-N1)-methyltransferase TrmD [Verrucomicrobiae bacterium]
MQVHILTIFPDMFSPLRESILARASQKGIVQFNLVDFRQYAYNKHKNVDDYPYGGGAGMVLKPEPIFEAVRDLPVKGKPKVVLMTPQGKVFNQGIAKELAQSEELVFICGHYEGFDERIRTLADLEISIGDYVLTGGELAAMVVIDATARLIPGVLGEQESYADDSFAHGVLEYPQYTRPPVYEDMEVPAVLLSGDHGKVAAWRRKEALRKTLLRRPDLFSPSILQVADFPLLRELMAEDERISGLSHLWLEHEPPPKLKRGRNTRRQELEKE